MNGKSTVAKYKNLMQVLFVVSLYLILQHMVDETPFALRLGSVTNRNADVTDIRAMLVTVEPSSQCVQDVRAWVRVMGPIVHPENESNKQIEQAMSAWDGKLGRAAVAIKLDEWGKNPPPACDTNIVLWHKNQIAAYLSMHDGFVMWEQYMFGAGSKRIKTGVTIMKDQTAVMNDIFRPYAVE